MLETVAVIDDLRRDHRSVSFWMACEHMLETCAILVDLETMPTCRYSYTVSLHEARRLWGLFYLFEKEPFAPASGDEIMVRQHTGYPYNGSRRASVLKTLNRQVPAIVVSGQETDYSKPKWKGLNLSKPINMRHLRRTISQ